jgi:hypothetical protein
MSYERSVHHALGWPFGDETYTYTTVVDLGDTTVTIDHRDEQQALYLYDGFSRCPFCGAANPDCDNLEVDGPEVVQESECFTCGKRWRDVYRLVGFEEIA